MNFAKVGIFAIASTTEAIKIGHEYDVYAQKQSIPACNSFTFPKCVTEAETAAPTKLQADQDKHDKDYFVPNFGVDHDVITTASNLKNAEAKLSHTWKLSLAQGDGPISPADMIKEFGEKKAMKMAYNDLRDNIRMSMTTLLDNFGDDWLGQNKAVKREDNKEEKEAFKKAFKESKESGELKGDESKEKDESKGDESKGDGPKEGDATKGKEVAEGPPKGDGAEKPKGDGAEGPPKGDGAEKSKEDGGEEPKHKHHKHKGKGHKGGDEKKAPAPKAEGAPKPEEKKAAF